jgi:protein phosphatase
MTAARPWKKSIRYDVQTDVGLRRANNQDSHIVNIASSAKQWLEHGHLFVVADGMGAHVAGEVASRLAVDTVAKSYINQSACNVANLKQALYNAHHAIRSRSKQDAYRSMGTTCDAFALTPQGLIIGHVGDSRVYRLRGHSFEQLTFDHSLLWEILARFGTAPGQPFEQMAHIPKNQITRSLGPVDNLEVDGEGPFPIEVGDVILACSDGLTGQVRDEEIGQILAVMPPDLAAESLINLANIHGGPDNITVAIVQATESPAESEAVDNALSVPLQQWSMLGFSFLSLCGLVGSVLAYNTFLMMFLTVLTVIFATAFFTMTRHTLFNSNPFTPRTAPLGKAPYRSWQCTPSKEFADTLAKLFNELKNASFCRQFNIHSLEAEQCETEAMLALQENHADKAIFKFLQAINALMRELKKLRKRH